MKNLNVVTNGPCRLCKDPKDPQYLKKIKENRRKEMRNDSTFMKSTDAEFCVLFIFRTLVYFYLP